MKRRVAPKIHRTTIALSEDSLPTEFRIWKSGVNTTMNGYDVLFDEAAAKAVMAVYEKHGVDIQIDLEHLSLDDGAANFDPDARGWCKLELRKGELWAVSVRWTDDGARRLEQKLQRYVSPAFHLDEDSRPTRLFNIALVAKPGTDAIEPLVAKDCRLSQGPSFGDVTRAVCEALMTKYPSSCAYVCELYDTTVVYELDGKCFEAPYVFDGSVATVAEGLEVRRVYQPVSVPAEELSMKINVNVLGRVREHVTASSKAGLSPSLTIKTLAEGDAAGQVAGVDIAALADFLAIDVNPAQDPAGFVKALLAKLDEVAGKLRGDAPAEAPAAEGAPAPEEMAAAKAIMQVCGAKSATDALLTVAGWKTLAVNHQAELQRLADEKKALEATKYRQLAARLVVCRAELPSTAWADEAKTVPAKHILSQSIEQLEQRCLSFEALNGSSAPKRPAAPTGGPGTVAIAKTIQVDGVDVHMSAEEVKRVEDRKADINAYAAIKLRQGRTGAVTLEG